ncbi:MAG: hypothetical protein HY606_00790 [Planctomycetes bacterium]|nr:hypothetical protein [Planctomycetota bacterium]
MRYISIIFSVLFVSCSSYTARYKMYPSNPFTNIKRVAVLPLVNDTKTPIRYDEFENILASEIVKFKGFDVVRPNAVRAALAGVPDISTEKNLKWLGKTLGVDSVLEIRITDYDAYYPPRITVLVNFVKTDSIVSTSVEDIDRLISSPTWATGNLKKEVAPFVIAQFEKTFDTHNEDLRDRVIGFYNAHHSGDYAFNEAGNTVLYVQKTLWQFVCTEVIRNIIELKQISIIDTSSK